MRLNQNGWYLIEAKSLLLEAIDQEDMEALIHYTAKEHPDLDYMKTMSIDHIIPEFFLYLANKKLEELKEELRENPPIYTAEEEKIRQWMKVSLNTSIEKWKNSHG